MRAISMRLHVSITVILLDVTTQFITHAVFVGNLNTLTHSVGMFIRCRHTKYTCLPSLSAFAELRNATISFVMSVRMEQVDSHWTDIHVFFSLVFFENPPLKFKFH